MDVGSSGALCAARVVGASEDRSETSTRERGPVGSDTLRLSDDPSDAELDLCIGDTVGRFVLLRRLGAGGMSIVFLAYDPELDRNVALKLMRPGRSPSARTRARLRGEAQALAQLNHPGVVAVYEVGELGDELFMAMEFVEGQTLRKWCTERSPSVAQILGVARRVGEALVAAHGAGLVHRDVKPDNVLVGADGRVRLVDFGLAQPGRDTVVSREHTPENPSIEHATLDATAGTPAYMAPEQHQGLPTSAASDQFSFCVMLYEALYGERPFPGEAAAAYATAVTSGMVRPPPRGHRVPTWLRRVVLRGLDVEPVRRHPTMDRLLRSLSLTRRHRRYRVAGLVAGGALLGGLGYVSHGPQPTATTCDGAPARVEAVWNRDRGRRIAAAFAATGKPYAARATAELTARLDELTRDWSVMHAQACEATRVRGEQSERLMDQRMGCLQQRLDTWDATLTLMESADATTVKRAVAMSHGLPTVEPCGDVETLRLGIDPPSPARAPEVAVLRRELADAAALSGAGRGEEALATARPVYEAAEQIGYRPLTVEALYRIAEAHDRQGQHQQAADAYEDCVFHAEASRYDRLAARAWVDLVQLRGFRLAQADEGQRAARRAEAAIERLGGDPKLRAYLRGNTGSLLTAAGRYDDALVAYRESLHMREALLGPDALDTAVALNSVGSTLARLGRNDEALPLLLRSLDIMVAPLGQDHPDVGALLTNIANVHESLDRVDEALVLRRRAMRIFERAYDDTHPWVAIGHNSLGATLLDLGRPEEALEELQVAAQLRAKVLGEDHPGYAATLGSIARALRRLERFDEAIDHHRRSLAIAKASRPGDHPRAAAGLVSLSVTLRRAGSPAEAVQRAREALEMSSRLFGERHRKTVSSRRALGRALLAVGDDDAALREVERALEIQNAAAGPAASDLAETWFAVAEAVAATERPGLRAQILADHAAATFATAGPKRADRLRALEDWRRAAGI